MLLLIPGILFQLAVMRARQRAGIPKVTLRSQLIPVGQRWVMGMLFVVFVGVTVFLDSWGIDSKLHDVITNLALALILAFPMVWRGVHLRLWEHLLIAASFPVGVGLLVTQAAELRLGWLCLVLGLGQLIAGYSLHRRWIAWVHALPRTTHMTDTNDSEVSA